MSTEPGSFTSNGSMIVVSNRLPFVLKRNEISGQLERKARLVGNFFFFFFFFASSLLVAIERVRIKHARRGFRTFRRASAQSISLSAFDLPTHRSVLRVSLVQTTEYSIHRAIKYFSFRTRGESAPRSERTGQ